MLVDVPAGNPVKCQSAVLQIVEESSAWGRSATRLQRSVKAWHHFAIFTLPSGKTLGLAFSVILPKMANAVSLSVVHIMLFYLPFLT